MFIFYFILNYLSIYLLTFLHCFWINISTDPLSTPFWPHGVLGWTPVRKPLLKQYHSTSLFYFTRAKIYVLKHDRTIAQLQMCLLQWHCMTHMTPCSCLKSFRSTRSAHAHQLILLCSIMAARGHVQDPNDRRLRPIYGKIHITRLSLYRPSGSD